MPKTTKTGTAKKSDAGTLQRSGRKAQQTFAGPTIGDGPYDDERRRTRPRAALAHPREVGTSWGKDETARPTRAASANRDRPPTASVDANASKAHLYSGHSAQVKDAAMMTKAELVDALQKANDRASAQARSRRQT
jgi:hypothetical protein